MNGTGELSDFRKWEAELDISESEASFYHDGRGQNLKKPGHLANPVPLDKRIFVSWDGESGSGHDTVQDYHLFLAYTPDGPKSIRAREGLTTSECLQFIVDIEEQYPDVIHIGFGFGYDVNQILATLNEYQLQTIQKTGILYLDFRRWRIEWRKGKSLTITRYYSDNHRTSVVIYDVWHFFTTSLVKALEKFGVCPEDELELIREGKKRRGTFTYDEIDDFVLPYCAAECKALIRLMWHFRKLMYGVDFKIRHWHGPGAIASYLLKGYGIKDVMSTCPEEVRLAAQHAYAAGRFELPKVGATGSLWGVDINSAYPYAITKLPDLARGHWEWVERPSKIATFGVYRIKSKVDMRVLFTKTLAPLFHRDRQGRISFPWIIDGWYWSPEASLVVKRPDQYEILEGWVFVPDKGSEQSRPFAWVARMYKQRQEWKEEGNAAEYPLKLALNSLYGKMAQRVGFNKKTMKPPPWHQLEWAGWVTSYCRMSIYRIGCMLGLDNIVAIETDGIYTTRDPKEVGIESSTELGGLKVSYYEVGIYVQNGLAWLAKNVGEDEWEMKYRGLDPQSVPLGEVISHLSSTDWNKPLSAETTRFVGIGAALMSKSWRERWRVFETVPRSIAVGGDGKRIHVSKLCRACKKGLSPMEALHDLVTNMPVPGMSAPHPLPWVVGVGREPPWRSVVEYERELLIPDV